MRRCTGMLGAIIALIFAICQTPVMAQTQIQGTSSGGGKTSGNPVWVQTDDGAGNLVRITGGGGGGAVTQSGLWINQIFGVNGTTVATAANPFPVYLQTGTSAIGSVTVTSSALPSGASSAANQTSVQSAPGTTQTTAVTIQGNASSLPVPVVSTSPPLYSYVITSTSGTATVTGIYRDVSGLQVGPLASYSVTTGTTLTTLAGGTLPAGAVGFVGMTNTPLWFGNGGQVGGTIASGQTPAAGYPQIPASTTQIFTLGRVSP